MYELLACVQQASQNAGNLISVVQFLRKVNYYYTQRYPTWLQNHLIKQETWTRLIHGKFLFWRKQKDPPQYNLPSDSKYVIQGSMLPIYIKDNLLHRLRTNFLDRLTWWLTGQYVLHLCLTLTNFPVFFLSITTANERVFQTDITLAGGITDFYVCSVYYTE